VDANGPAGAATATRGSAPADGAAACPVGSVRGYSRGPLTTRCTTFAATAALLLAARAVAQTGAEGAAPPGVIADPIAALGSLPLRPDAEQPLRVHVRGADGAPATDAFVVWLAADDAAHAARLDDATQLFPGDEPRIWAFRAAASGVRFVVDERGVARVPATAGRVLAGRGAALASTLFEPRVDEVLPQIELVLWPPWTVAAEVVDAAGRPAVGVAIGLCQGERGSPLLQRRTAGDGRAPFRLAGAPLAGTHLVALVASLAPRVAPAPETDGSIVRLQLPPCGVVRASFVGDLLPGAELVWALATADRQVEPCERDGASALFRFVEVGFTGRVQVAIDGEVIAAAVADVRLDAECRVELQAPPLVGRRVVLRVLDGRGEPARRAQVVCSWRTADGGSDAGGGAGAPVQPRRTNAAGWLEVPLAETALGAGTLSLELRGGADDTPVLARLELPIAADERGRIERGEQRFTAAR
jgi:hypothetical protein